LLLSTTAQEFTYASGGVSTDVYGYKCDTGILLPIQPDNNVSSSSNSYAYWVNPEKMVNVANADGISDFSLAGGYGSIKVKIPAYAKATLHVGDTSSSADIIAPPSSESTITHAFIDNNGAPCRTSIALTSTNEEVSLVYENDAITLSGADEATISAEENGKQYALVLTNLGGHAKIKISDIISTKNIVGNSENNNSGPSNNGSGQGGALDGGTDTAEAAIIVAPESNVPLSRPNANPFTDIRESDWFYYDVIWANANALFNGTSSTEFSPRLPMTRAMLVTVLGRLYGLVDTTPASSFSDVDSSAYYAPYVKWAKQAGIVTGISEDRFAPSLPITRQDLAAILYRYEQFVNKIPSDVVNEREFSDMSSISDYAKNAVNALAVQGIISGKPNNMFDPKGNATRAEVAAVLHRFVESLGDDSAI